jgi:hypothetical protein
MMKQITLILLALLIAGLPFTGQAQYQFYTSSTGASGSVTVTGTTIVNQYYKVTGLAQSGNNYQVTCAGGFSGAPGQRVLLIEMNGSSHTGSWEIDTVQTSGNPCTIVSNFAVSFDSAASSTIQLVTIPQYVGLTIANNGVLTAAPYNDTTGGVLVFEVQDTFVWRTMRCVRAWLPGQYSNCYWYGGVAGRWRCRGSGRFRWCGRHYWRTRWWRNICRRY